MSAYSLVRSVYRWIDKLLLKHLPAEARLRGLIFRVARRLFPGRITARSAGEFAGNAPSRQGALEHLPAWARAEVATLARLEPSLHALLGDDASVEPYLVPWDLNYVGLRYANVRRQLTGDYACFVLLAGGASAVDTAMLASAPRPLAVIDLDDDAEIANMAHVVEADYLTLPTDQLDSNDHCAVLARLVLQLAPGQVRYVRHPLLERCIQRHGLAMASVSKLEPWTAPMSTVTDRRSEGAEQPPQL